MTSPPSLDLIHPPGDALSADEAMSGLRLGDGATEERPYVVVNMVSTADGRATLQGRTTGMGGPGDRALFHELRTQVDAVMFGAGTARIERYGRMISGERAREKRRREGLDPDPLACVVSGRADLAPDLPMLADPECRVVVITASQGEIDGVRARVEYLRPEAEGDYLRRSSRGGLALAPILRRLRHEHGVRSILCEGGPHLNRALMREGLVDELFLTLAPKVTADETAPTIVAGPPLGGAVELELLRVLREGHELFLRYRVRG